MVVGPLVAVVVCLLVTVIVGPLVVVVLRRRRLVSFFLCVASIFFFVLLLEMASEDDDKARHMIVAKEEEEALGGVAGPVRGLEQRLESSTSDVGATRDERLRDAGARTNNDAELTSRPPPAKEILRRRERG